MSEITFDVDGNCFEDEVQLTRAEFLDHPDMSNRSKLSMISRGALFDPGFVVAATTACTRAIDRDRETSQPESDATVNHYLHIAIHSANNIECIDDLEGPYMDIHQFKMALSNSVNVAYVAAYNANAYKGESTARSIASAAAETERAEQVANLRETLV